MIISTLFKNELGISKTETKIPDSPLGVTGISEGFVPEDMEGLNNVMLSLESAISDLANYDDREVGIKYNNMLTASDFGESLTKENAVMDFLIDSTVYTLEKIWLVIKNLYTSGINYLKKIYATFLATHTKSAQLLDFDKMNGVNLKEKLGMFVDSNGFLDQNLPDFMLGTEHLRSIVEKVTAVNNTILLAMPVGEVMKTVIEGNTGPMNDIVNTYRTTILDKYTTSLFGKNVIDIVNKNIIYTNVTTEVPNPYIVTSDGFNSKVLSMSENGIFKLNNISIRKDIPTPLKHYLDTMENINKGMSNQINLKNLVLEDFKVYDRMKKDADSYLLQTKKYNKIDNYNLYIVSNNLAVMFNMILGYSLNRIELFNKINEYGVIKA